MAAPLILRILGDASSYYKTAETTIATNTKIASSFGKIGTSANLSAEAQVAAAVKAIRAQETQLSGLQTIQARSVAGSREQIAAAVAVGDAQARLNRLTGISTVAIGRSSDVVEKATRRFHGYARSLLAVSAGFLGFTAASSLIRGAIKGADDLSSAQASLALAVQRTGGDLDKLQPRYEAVAQGARKYGEDVAAATSALARATLLTGDAEKAQRAYEEALVISKALGKDFNAVLTATAKGQDGLTSSLTKYGVILAKGASGTEQFSAIMGRFAGQAKANTSNIDVYNASLRNSEIIIGSALLPVLNKYLGQIGEWLTKMNKSGRLQKDVNGILSTAGHVFHTLGRVIGVVDRVTGSFARTLEIIIGLRVASALAGWIGSIGSLAAAWRGVTVAAGEAAAAESLALGGGASGVAARVAMYTGIGAAATGAGASAAGAATKLSRLTSNIGLVGVAAAIAIPQIQRLQRYLSGGIGGTLGGTAQSIYDYTTGFFSGGAAGKNPLVDLIFGNGDKPPSRNGAPLGATGPVGMDGPSHRDPGRTGSTRTSGSRPVTLWANYQLDNAEQMAAIRASLTKSNADDVAAAKAVVARVKRTIAQGHLKGQALIAALQVESGALQTIWSAEDAAAQERAAKAQAAADRIAAQIQNSIDPLRLEVALSKAQALGKPLIEILKKLRAAARAALASGKLSLEQQKEAWDQIASLNQQIADASKKGADQAKQSAHQFRLASTRALTAGLHLTAEQRKALRARLSQLGPGGHIPDTGTGAYGYVVGNGGRPIHHHHHIYVDGKEVEHSVTKHQQKRRRRSSSQRRGPNAGD